MSLVATTEGRSRLSQRWTPCTALRPYVRSFELRDNYFGDAEVFNPLPARTDCFLQFHLRRPRPAAPHADEIVEVSRVPCASVG